MFAVTGASGHLGRLVLGALIAEVPASQVVALARDPAKLSDCLKAGVVVRLNAPTCACWRRTSPLYLGQRPRSAGNPAPPRG
jgi:hypothetical protein